MSLKAVVAMDSFKGCLPSLHAGEAVREGILRVFENAEVYLCPLADGGEGTVNALTHGLGGTISSVQVTGPIGQTVEVEYGILPDGVTAVMEMAAAAGITLVEKENRNPFVTTTFGVGEMIHDAINKGCRHFIMGIGGSATNDGGIGMLQALGFGLLDDEGKQVSYGAQGLQNLRVIRTEQVIPELSECTFRVACDVTNPLCGENGASRIFGPQKGASTEQIGQMDEWLSRYAELARRINPKADPESSGAGAAGGLGFAFRSFTDATLESGIKIILEETGLEEKVRKADYVITGEGRLDGQTVMGKAPAGVAVMAKKYGVPVIAFAGCVTPEAGICNSYGIDAFFPILRSVVDSATAKNPKIAYGNLADTAEQVFRLLKSCSV